MYSAVSGFQYSSRVDANGFALNAAHGVPRYMRPPEVLLLGDDRLDACTCAGDMWLAGQLVYKMAVNNDRFKPQVYYIQIVRTASLLLKNL